MCKNISRVVRYVVPAELFEEKSGLGIPGVFPCVVDRFAYGDHISSITLDFVQFEESADPDRIEPATSVFENAELLSRRVGYEVFEEIIIASLCEQFGIGEILFLACRIVEQHGCLQHLSRVVRELAGFDFTDLYLLTGKKEYLSQAKMVWRFIESGTDDKLGYGIYWCEQKKNGKNTCSNAPGSVYASKLFLATGDSSYLQAGIRLYEWTKENLQDPADGLYFDNKSLNGEIGRAKFAYNSGQMMQSAALLYRITGEKKYLQEAQRLAAACYNRFFSHDSQSDRKYKVLNRGDVWFTAIMFRGFVELYGIDHNSLYIDAFRENLDFAWTEMREKNGLFNDDWSGKTKNDSKWLLTQFAMVEMYARLAAIDKENNR